MDYCICISFAMFFGLVKMLLLPSVMQIKWWCFKILEYFPIYFFGADFIYFSIFRFLEIYSLVYLVVIFLACIFVVLANVALLSICF